MLYLFNWGHTHVTFTLKAGGAFLQANYSTGKESIQMKIYIGNIPEKYNREELTGLFMKYGKVDEIKIITDLATGKPRGFGFVVMPVLNEKTAAINALNDYSYNGRKLVVTHAIDRENLNS